MKRRWLLFVLVLFLFSWEPMRVAGEVTQSLPTMGTRGGLAIVEHAGAWIAYVIFRLKAEATRG